MNIFAATIVWIIIIGSFTFFLRNKIAWVFKRLPLPKFILFLLSGMFFATIEENINCPGNDCSNVFPVTLVVFFAFLIIHYLILKILRFESFYKAIFVYGILGWVAEFLMGGNVGILWSSPIIFFIMTPWVLLTYAIIVIVPVTIFLEEDKTKTKIKK